MQVLVSTTSGMGHVGPCLPVARVLADAGHAVTWVSAADAQERIEAEGHRFVAAGLTSGERRELAGDRLAAAMALPTRERRSRLFATLFAEVAAPALLDRL